MKNCKYVLNKENLIEVLEKLKKFKGMMVGHITVNGKTDGLTSVNYDPKIVYDEFGAMKGIKITDEYTITFGDEVEFNENEFKSSNVKNTHNNYTRMVFV